MSSSSSHVSKKVEPKSTASKMNRLGKDASTRTRNTSGPDAAIGGALKITIHDKDVTPKALAPLKHVHKDPAKAAGEGGIPSEGRVEEKPGLEEKLVEFAPSVPVALERLKPPPKPPGLSKEELDRQVDIILSETETITLFHVPSMVVELTSKDSEAINKRNKAYEELVNSKSDDQFHEQHAQTINNPHKSKDVLAAPPTTESVEVNASQWDIHDTFATDPVPKHKQIQMACEKETAAAVALAVKKPGCMFTMREPYPSETASTREPTKRDRGKVSGISGGKSGTLGRSHVSQNLTTSKTLNVSGSVAAETITLAVPSVGPVSTEVEVTSPRHDEGEHQAELACDPMPWRVGEQNLIPEELTHQLRIMERIVSQNVFHSQHMIYRNYPTLDELAKLERLLDCGDKDAVGADSSLDATGRDRKSTATGDGDVVVGEGSDGPGDEPSDHESVGSSHSGNPRLQDLFCFQAPKLTQGMNVTCAEWNRHNQDLLAVSYGDTIPVPNTEGGLVLFWSLKNPTYPERVLRTKSGVTSLSFSVVNPNMVAAGTHAGSVLIWDLRRPGDQPALQSGSSNSVHNNSKHKDIVWETRWVDQCNERQDRELLVSVSSDGYVFQWSTKKGLEQTPLMQLKRVTNPNLGSNSVYGPKEGIVCRRSSGFCIDFPKHDPHTYLVGTEDGLVHQCSTSYNEQYLDTYYGHSGPVYKVRCNPFMSHAFLTCSADWTMRLWTTKPIPNQPEACLLNFASQNLCDAVNDVVWAPKNSTSFAAAMDDGRVELWDLSEKPLDPLVVHYPGSQRRRRTCVRFSPNSPVLVAGDDQGSVDVMRMHHTDVEFYSDAEQQDRLNAVMVKKR